MSDEAERLLQLAYWPLMDYQAVLAALDNADSSDASQEAYERVRGICQQIEHHIKHQ